MGTTVLFLAIAIPSLLLLFLINLPRVDRLRELASHRLVCPTCGERFRVKWLRLLLVKWQVEATDKATLTCPVCKTRDICRRENSVYEEGERA